MESPRHPPTTHLSSLLRASLENDGNDLTVGLLLDRVGARGFGLLFLLLSLPSALPIPAPGYSIPFGILLCLLAAQMIVGRSQPVLPARARRIRLTADLATRILTLTARFFARVERLVKPRMHWVRSRWASPFIGVLIFFMALLMLVPIPFTNSLPAIIVLLIGIGLTEKDGLLAIIACTLGVLTAMAYATLIVLAFLHGPEVMDQLSDWLKQIF